MNKYLSSHRE
jgi:hypothetical protein